MTEFLQQLINGIASGSIYALIALGYTMVYGVLRLINFAHGDVYMVGAMSGYYFAQLFTRGGGWLRFSLVMLGSMAVCAALGALIERLAYRPLRKAPRINALITAIGVSIFLEYLGQYLFGADPKRFPSLLPEENLVNIKGVVITNIQMVIFVVSIILMLALNWIVQRTKVGKALRAVSYSHTASYLVGIPVNQVISLTFVFGSVLAAAAGILIGLNNPRVDPLMGLLPGLKAFVAAVLGGIGSIPGALVGGLLMGISETFVAGYISDTYRNALAFVLLILILLVRPTGLFGKTSQEKV